MDNVNHPEHYNAGSVECIDAIEASMDADAFMGFLKGNVIKYLWRYEHKGGLEDLRKAEFYLKRHIQTAEKISRISMIMSPYEGGDIADG